MKKTFVLVNGAFAGSYAWDHVKPLIEQAGHKVVTMDLPGHGDDQTPPNEATFDAYLNAVIAPINAETEPVILVGHSMGGVVVSAVAEAIPEKI
jgi:alpha-beta hydrolase superfamily lysophospholipase